MMDEDFDFGFISTTPEDIAAPIIVSKTAKNDETIDKLIKAITPLLDNLAKDADKDVIHWPNRAAKIEEFRKKIYKIAGKPLPKK
jgi:diketogulonate reductase-like aldo/keto reductase